MKQTLQFNHLWRVALCGCLVAITSSCVDDSYDLDNGISSDVNIFGSLTVPIGKISPIYLSKILNVDSVDMLTVNADGSYVISETGSFDADIDALGDDFEITIDGISEGSDINESIADDTELPSFGISIVDNTEVKVDLTKITIEASDETVSGSTDLNPNYPSEIQMLAAYPTANIPVEAIELPVELEPIESELNIAPEISCPDVITKISNLQFGETSEGVEIKITFDITSLATGFGSLEWQNPQITLAFPEGFILSSGSNVEVFPVTTLTGSVYEVSTKVLSYNKDIVPNADGSIAAIEGTITCNIEGDMKIVSGVTNGSSFDITQSFSLDVVSDKFTVGNIDLTVAGLEIPVDGMSISDNITIDDIPTNISSIGEVAFVDNTNDLTISVAPIVLPEGLAITSSESITIGFPTDRFEISGYDVKSSSTYDVYLPTSDLVSADGIERVVAIEAMNLENSTISDGTLTFVPGIVMGDAKIVVGGELSLLDYNAYLDSYSSQNLDFSANAEALDIDVAEFTVSSIEIDIPVQSTAVQISEEVPSELGALYSMDFTNEVTATISIDLTGLPVGSTAGDLVFDNYSISFPKFIVFAGDEVDADNVLSLDGVVLGDKEDVTRVYNKVLTIESFDFTSDEYSDLITTDDTGTSYIYIDDEVALSGGLLLESGSATSDLGDITGRVDFVISEISAKTVSGRISPEMPEVSESIDLSDLTDQISLGSMSVTLSNPTINIDIKNSLTIGLEISTLSIIPYKDGAEKSALKCTESIAIAALPLDAAEGEYAVTNVTLTPNSSSAAGYYQMTGLESILEDMPDSLKIEVLSDVADGTHTLDLTRSYDLQLDYAVNVPLEFSNLEVNYTDTLSDLASSFEDLIEMVPSLELQLEISSTLPFTVELVDITPMDIYDNVLDLPNMLPESCVIKGSNGSVETSNISLSLSNNDAGDLELLDKLLFTIKATIDTEDGDSSVALNESQYVQLGLKVVLPEGLNIDLDDLSDDSDDDENSIF